MRILLVHQNYPGQFPRLAAALEARGHSVLALTDARNARAFPQRHARYRFEPPAAGGSGAAYAQAMARGQAAAAMAEAVKRRHRYEPDVILGHSGWGETLFLREVWPGARLLSYAEFCYRPRGLDCGFDPEFAAGSLEDRIAVTARQAHIIHAVATADAALAPTRWQKASFPSALQESISVIHDGIDTRALRPDPNARFALPGGGTLHAGDEVLTYASRRLEPYRGFHVFMRALPEVLAARPDAQVVIAGEVGQSYGPPPQGAATWKHKLLAELGEGIDLRRVHFVGRLPYTDFVSLMQVSRVHAYLTYPFVLSWSILEAMACGAFVVGSRTPPVEEVIADGVNGRLVGFFDIEGWQAALVEGLAQPALAVPMRAAARETIAACYDFATVCGPRLVALVEQAGTGLQTAELWPACDSP